MREPVQELKDCDCVGYGDGEFLYSDDDCPRCHGTGHIEKEDDMEPKDLHDEAFREYEFASGKLYKIMNPVTLYVGRTTHRVVDAQGVVHCVPFPGPAGDTVMRWTPRDPAKPVAF